MSAERIVTWEELRKHNKPKNLWMVIHGYVYDCTKFLDEHPGGEEVMIEQGGMDATAAFDEIGHSDDAREMLKDMLVGKIESGESKATSGSTAATEETKKKAVVPGDNQSWLLVLAPALAVVTAYIIYKYMN